MPLARKLRKKKNLIGVCYFALFSLIIMITSFKRNYLTLARACFYKGKISRKSSSLLSVIYSMRFLDAHGSMQKKKMKLLEIAGNEKIKQEWLILSFEFVAVLT